MHHAGSNDQYDIEQVSGTFLDSPATTSAVTYKMQVGTPHSSSYAVLSTIIRRKQILLGLVEVHLQLL